MVLFDRERYPWFHGLMLAPMAGVTDCAFRYICQELGAGYGVSEMVPSRPDLQQGLKSRYRMRHQGIKRAIAVQIVGAEPLMMADAARYHIDQGAQVIDINMGCPAKKVCHVWSGSALMQNEALAIDIMKAVVQACEPYQVPVTLKMRTGWSAGAINAPLLARAAQEQGIQMVVVHGRTREQGYKGPAQYDTVAQIKSQLHIPVVANGDIDSPQKADQVLKQTGVDGLMVGRAAIGRPWIFKEIAHYLQTGQAHPPFSLNEIQAIIKTHWQHHFALYDENQAVRHFRKHWARYAQHLPVSTGQHQRMMKAESAQAQSALLAQFFDEWSDQYGSTATHWKEAA